MGSAKNLQPEKFEGMSIFRPPLCRELTGRQFSLVMDDGFDRVIHFVSDNELSVSVNGGEAAIYAYECLKAEDKTYFVNYEIPGKWPRVGVSIVLDLEQSLVTAATANLGQNPAYPRMPAIEFTFGAIEGEDGTVPTIRHGYTRDLVGRGINWCYGTFDVIHVYASERFYRVGFSPRRIESMRRKAEAEGRTFTPMANPMGAYEDYADYIKIKDDVYLVSLLETNLCRTRGHGNSLLFVMNFKDMHDVGRSFGTNDDGGDENYTFGAFGEDYDATETLNRESHYFIR